MKILPANSVFDVSEWFLNTALNDNETLQPMKMQSLMYFSQAYYAAFTQGKRFMPSIFIATKQGPIEPNAYRLYEFERPILPYQSPQKTTNDFLKAIWARFGSYSTNYLYRIISTHPPYVDALQRGEKEEISLQEMALFYRALENNEKTIKFNDLEERKLLHSQTGKTVCVKKWTPQHK